MPNGRRGAEVPFGTTTLTERATTMNLFTIAESRRDSEQPILDTWCRRCMKFGHTATHARALAHDCSNSYCEQHPVVLDMESM
jgi:hypothetical protein